MRRLDLDWTPVVHSARSTFAVLQLGPVRVFAADLPPSLFEGPIRKGQCAVWMGLNERHRSVVNGELLPEPALVLGGPEARCQAYWPIDAQPSQTAVAISFPIDVRPEGWPPPAPLFTVHRVAGEGLLGLRRHLWRLFRLASSRPDLFEGEGDRRAMGMEAVDEALRLITTAAAQPPATPATVRNAIAMLDQIDLFVNNRLDRPILLQDVAESLGVSPRTIHNVMKKMRGMTLQEYVKILRMRSVRRHLLRNDGCDLVKQAALGHGFLHLGRFAQAYTKFFGEAPSTTLSQRCVDRMKE